MGFLGKSDYAGLTSILLFSCRWSCYWICSILLGYMGIESRSGLPHLGSKKVGLTAVVGLTEALGSIGWNILASSKGVLPVSPMIDTRFELGFEFDTYDKN